MEKPSEMFDFLADQSGDLFERIVEVCALFLVSLRQRSHSHIYPARWGGGLKEEEDVSGQKLTQTLPIPFASRMEMVNSLS